MSFLRLVKSWLSIRTGTWSINFSRLHDKWVWETALDRGIRITFRGTQQRFPAKDVENTFQAIESSFRTLEIHSKRRYKICIRFGHPRGLWVFSKLQGLQTYFPKNFRCNLSFYESEQFSDSSLNHIFESENVRFTFSMKNSISWGVKCEKLSFRKL